jgi:hypothetical protein
LHPLELVFPEPDYGDYETASGLRKELNRIGVDPTTRIVDSKEVRPFVAVIDGVLRDWCVA